MKQKLYALDAFFIEKLKLSENGPSHLHIVEYMTEISSTELKQQPKLSGRQHSSPAAIVSKYQQ